jgi:hypothetical protein
LWNEQSKTYGREGRRGGERGKEKDNGMMDGWISSKAQKKRRVCESARRDGGWDGWSLAGGKRQRRAGGKNERPNPTPDGDEMIRQSWDPEGAGDEEDDDGEVKKKK